MMKSWREESGPTVEAQTFVWPHSRCMLFLGVVLWCAAAQRASLWGAYCALTNSLAGMNALCCPS